MKFGMKSYILVLVVMVSLSFSACGGGSSSNPPPPTTYTIGGTVSGLSGTGLALQDNGGNSLPVSANGGFTFTTSIASGGTYNVTVFSPPSNPTQSCAVTNGSGTANANVTSVRVACVGGDWTWMGGSDLNYQPGTYGTQGTPAPGNIPGGRDSALTWTDASGDFWLFGGEKGAVADNYGTLNDLWKYSAGEWTWISGSNQPDQPGIYGTLGKADPNNVPGSRYGAVTWTDASGNLWLFGGSSWNRFNGGAGGFYNDLWEYSGAGWTWVSGSNAPNQQGMYGTQGTPAPGNIPGARYGAASWTDPAGNFWLFGGVGWSSNGVTSYLNDLWRYSAGEWTWMGGSSGPNQQGTYGTQGTAAPGNAPGARLEAVSWTDSAGNFWLFGGAGYGSQGTPDALNDLWKYSASEWTWMGGSNMIDQKGTYGVQGMAAPANIPGAREQAVAWTDASGNVWLFGGLGLDSQGNGRYLNDLWRYSAGEWTWMAGFEIWGRVGIYGTQGTPAPDNAPGSRQGPPMGWMDASGSLWLFGGYGLGNEDLGELNDLWRYEP
jgi:Kelch motif